MQDISADFSWLSGLIVFLAFLSFFVVVIRHELRETRENEANLRALANLLRLDFFPRADWAGPDPRVTGTMRGRKVKLFRVCDSDGPSMVAVSAQLTRPSALKFCLDRRSFFRTELSDLFQQHEPTTGDAVFDAAWRVRSNQPEFIIAALCPDLRAKLMATHGTGRNITLVDGLVKFVGSDDSFNADICERIPVILDAVCDLADIVEAAPNADDARSL
jgi:hypothetical protein